MSIKDKLQRKKRILEKWESRKLKNKVKKNIKEYIAKNGESGVEIRGTLEFVDGRENVQIVGQCYMDENNEIWVLLENEQLVKFDANHRQRNMIEDLMRI